MAKRFRISIELRGKIVIILLLELVIANKVCAKFQVVRFSNIPGGKRETIYHEDRLIASKSKSNQFKTISGIKTKRV